jgi:hypothetical protein
MGKKAHHKGTKDTKEGEKQIEMRFARSAKSRLSALLRALRVFVVRSTFGSTLAHASEIVHPIARGQ